MKLNGLTSSLSGNDKSLSNSYLQHIVELLRTEVANLSVKESALEEITNEHIETQKIVVDTETVNAKHINAESATLGSINDKIILSNVIDVLTTLRVNGKDVLTEAAFQGPFTYKGVVETLPETAEAGDVYITNDKVNIFNGTTWDEFTLPVGTVSLAEYNEDKAEIFNDISNIQSELDSTKTDLEDFKTDTETSVQTLFDNLVEVNAELVTKVDEAPEDDNAYVRKNGEWVDLNDADNTVKSIVGESVIENTEEGITINSPKVEVTTPDFKINGSDLPEVNKFGLSKTVEADVSSYYELKFGRSPFDATSSTRSMYCGYGNSYDEMAKTPPEKYTVFTKNWQYVKWSDSINGDDGGIINITAMDKDGNINLIANNFMDWIADSSVYAQCSCFITFNQEYVPEGWEDTVWLFCTGGSNTAADNTKKPYLIELKDGRFNRKIDLSGLIEQGYTPSQFNPTGAAYIGLTAGKGLRSNDVNRICIVCFNTANVGGNWAIIIGGDRNSNLNDPFDPSKCIYVPLPAAAYYSSDCMAVTDSAWYLQESSTGRIMKLTPNGQVVEFNLLENVISCGFNYIEYTDKNGRPAVAYYVHNRSSNGGHYVQFLEEGENGQTTLTERKVTSDAFTPTGSSWYAQLFKFMENSHYIFFTADSGYSVDGDANYGSASMKNILWYWDKKTLTTHAINNFYESLTFGANDFIEMHKTKGNTIWFPYLIQDLSAANRTGEVHFISDADYTSINEDTGIDEGEILVQTATVGADHSFFTCSGTAATSTMFYTHNLGSDGTNTQWNLANNRNQLSATNDDGILCLMSGDAKSIALCYGDGNIRVYPISSNSGIYDCDADKAPYLPDEIYFGNHLVGFPVLYGMTHGWVFQARANIDAISTGMALAAQVASYTYIGIKYRNGEPTILEAPVLSKIIRCGCCNNPQRIKWEKYAYLQTYDDYERRKKVLGGIRAYIGYGNAAYGPDSYFKEVRKEKKKINLTYNDEIISSVEE